MHGAITEHGISFERLADRDGRFTVNIMVDGRRIHRVVGRESDGITRTQAEVVISQLRTDALHERLALPQRRKLEMLFSDAAQRYLDELTQASGKDIAEKRRRLQLHLVPFFGGMRLPAIDSQSVELYKRARLAEPSLRGGTRRGKNAAQRAPANPTKLATRATVNRELAVLSHLLNHARQRGWAKLQPLKLHRFQEPRTRFEYLTESDIENLLLAARADSHPQIYPFIYIALHTAMRASEILSLRREFIDFDKLLIHLPVAKTGARDVPISPNLKAFLIDYVGSQPSDQSSLFPSDSSKSGHTDNLERPWQRIIKSAGLSARHITRHTLRHTAITHLVQAGVDLPTVQRISGHKSLQMVWHYSHQNQRHVQDALGKLDERIARSNSASR